MKFICQIIIFLITVPCIAQDIIVKNDSLKIEAKILEVTPTVIKYNFYNYLNGPMIIVSTSEISYIIYNNGYIEHFIKPKESEPQADKKREFRLTLKLELGVVINNAYANKPREDDPHGSMTSSENFSGYKKNNFKTGATLGFNMLYKTNKYSHVVFGLNYLQSKGEFDYDTWQGGYTSYHSHYHYNSNIGFLNLVSGFRFTIAKRLHLEPLVALNFIINRNERVTGFTTTTETAGSPPIYNPNYVSTSTVTTVYTTNSKAERPVAEGGASFCPRISYDVKIKNSRFDVYISYNVAGRRLVPSYLFGISYYPFKKFK